MRNTRIVCKNGSVAARRLPGAALAVLLLAWGCPRSDRTEPGSTTKIRASAVLNELPEQSPPAAPPAPAREFTTADTGKAKEVSDDSRTEGGDGSPIILSPLTAADIEGARLSGELGCSYEGDPSSVLLIAKGDVASSAGAQGVVKVGDYVEAIINREGGGFDALSDGADFVGKGKSIRIVVGQALPTPGGEAQTRKATLHYQRVDGASRRLSGLWTCGP
jgi:hypothetical protein